MIVSLDVAVLLVIVLIVALVSFITGLIVARRQDETFAATELIEKLNEMMLVPASVKDFGSNLQAAMEPELVATIRSTVDDAIKLNLPTEDRFRETVKAMVDIVTAAATPSKIKPSAKRRSRAR